MISAAAAAAAAAQPQPRHQQPPPSPDRQNRAGAERRPGSTRPEPQRDHESRAAGVGGEEDREVQHKCAGEPGNLSSGAAASGGSCGDGDLAADLSVRVGGGVEADVDTACGERVSVDGDVGPDTV